jgi:hypothetical protein
MMTSNQGVLLYFAALAILVAIGLMFSGHGNCCYIC